MGKKNRHSQDRLFITATEWAREYGGKKAAGSGSGVQSLPFDHCAMSLAPFETPVCTPEGVVFDLVNLVPYVRKHGANPCTGTPMTTKDIIRLNMHKDADGKWHCPVMCKVFNNNTHIVAIKPTGNVFSYDAVSELNIKPKHFVDLLTGESFTRADIITLQDPSDPDQMAKRDIRSFVHLNSVREQNSADKESESKIRANPIATSVMRELDKLKASEEDRASKFKQLQSSHAAAAASRVFTADVDELLALHPLTEDVNPGQVSTAGKAGSSLTSSWSDCWTDNSSRLATPDELREARWKVMRKLGKKCYAQIQTSLGNLNIELHCDMAQRTCWNFLTLCSKGYYNNTTFHRLVPGFMIQAGDPTGTGGGGESAFGGQPFKDEFDSRLWHESRGVISMANSGPNTNGSQFFITFGKAEHLNNLHTVFGRVVGGLSTLDRLEAVGADKKERPLTPILLNAIEVFSSPIAEADEILLSEIQGRMLARQRAEIPSALPSTATSGASEEESLPSSQSVASSSSDHNPAVTAAVSAPASISSSSSRASIASSSTLVESATRKSKVPVSTLAQDSDAAAAFLASQRNQGFMSSADSQAKKKAKSGGYGDFSSW